MRFSTVLTSEQAAILYDLVKEHRAAMIERWAKGMYEGLLMSLAYIDRGGGATLVGESHRWPSVVEYRNPIAAAVIPASSYIAWPGVTAVPEPFEQTETSPELSFGRMVFRPVILSKTSVPLAVIPLAVAVFDRPSSPPL